MSRFRSFEAIFGNFKLKNVISAHFQRSSLHFPKPVPHATPITVQKFLKQKYPTDNFYINFSSPTVQQILFNTTDPAATPAECLLKFVENLILKYGPPKKLLFICLEPGKIDFSPELKRKFPLFLSSLHKKYGSRICTNIIFKQSEKYDRSIDDIFKFISNQRLAQGFEKDGKTRHLLYSNESESVLKAMASNEHFFCVMNDGVDYEMRMDRIRENKTRILEKKPAEKYTNKTRIHSIPKIKSHLKYRLVLLKCHESGLKITLNHLFWPKNDSKSLKIAQNHPK